MSKRLSGGKANLYFLFVLFLIMAGCDQSSAAQMVPNSEKAPALSENATEKWVAAKPGSSPVAIDELVTDAVEQKAMVSRPTLAPDEWKRLPVVPTIGEEVLKIYLRGQELGNNPRAFSKVGDCESVTEWFLADFDKGEAYYSLGEYSELRDVIEYFQGSYKRLGQAAKPGYTASSLLTPLWADREQCEKDESPLACEIRQHKPSFLLITLGTNDAVNPKTFETNMRRVIEYSINHGVVPVLSTKADNREGNHSINETIARLASEYELPLWNFWAAAQNLPDQGLQEDGLHLTFGPNQFDDPQVMRRAWPVRNLTALQVLNKLRIAITANN